MMTDARSDPTEEPCRRWAGRAPLAFPGKLALSEGNFDCVVEDLSLGGARINCKRKIDIGREVWLKFDRFVVFGEITWRSDGQYGIEFEERISKSVVLEMQEFANDLEAYEEHQGMMAAKAYVMGERPPVVRSPLMRLLDVVGPIDRKVFPECIQCDSGEPCAIHCGHKEFKRAQLIRGGFYMAVAALTGAAIGIGSLLFG